MVKLLAISLLCALLGASTAQNVQPGDYPAHVALHITGNRFGEGVILNANHVLTLAQNAFGVGDNSNVRLAPADIQVNSGIVALAPPVIGTNPVLRIYAHDNYNFHSGKFNVAVLRVTNNFPLLPEEARPNTAPVTFYNRIVPNGYNCQMVGFLATAAVPANRNLAAANMPVMSRDLCNAVENPDIRGAVFDQNMCVGGVILLNANCNFNPGSAFYCDGQLVGLRTVGLACNAANSPGVLVQTRWFQDWIPQQFTRTDNPPPGVVAPPGVRDGNGASTIVLSTFALIMALLVSSF